jgi:cation diffusion facilitator family transporter
MIKLLSKWFVRDRENYDSPNVRVAYGVLCGAVGIALNLLLFTGKIFAGVLSRSIGVTADAFNNLSDAGSSVVSLAGFRLSAGKPDREHPFGHGRFEYIAGLAVSMAILLMGVELIKSSVQKIIDPQPVTFSVLTVVILGVSILIKLYMYLYNRSIGRKIDSTTMRATALDSFSDMAATGVVLASMFVSKWFNIHIDGWAGLAVALFILYTGVSAARETISPLLGQPPDAAFVKKIESIVLSEKDVVGVHDLVVHDYGPGRQMISLHAEVPADGSMVHLHDTVDNLERRLRQECGCEAVIHMDPVVLNDARTNRLRDEVETIVRGLDENLSVHDFRVVPGHTHTNLVFDVVVPFGFRMTDDEVRLALQRQVRECEGNLFAVVQIDKSCVFPPEKGNDAQQNAN